MIDQEVPVEPLSSDVPAESHPTATPRFTDWLAILNPTAGRGRNLRYWRRMEQSLRAAGMRCDVAVTASPGAGRELARVAVRAGRTRIIVAGGDGSVHDVVNGIMLANGSATGAVPTLVALPLGTGNDWSRSLGLPNDPARLVEILRRDQGVPHDVGRVSLPASATGTTQTHWFVNVAGAGFDAHVLARLQGRPHSGLAYLRGALCELRRYQSPVFQLQLDDVVIDGRLLLAFVANGQYCGRGMHVAPCALRDDGRFDVVTIAEVGLARALPKLARLFRGTLLHDPLVQHRTSARVRIDAEPAVAVEADGQLLGVTPAEFSIVPRALRVLHGH